MNMQRGLERISAVWWGTWIALGSVLAVASFLGYGSSQYESTLLMWLGVGGAVGALVAHKLTCWVIRGFFTHD